MKRFQFRLQQILKLREQKTRQAELRQRQVHVELMKARADVDTIETHLAQTSDAFAAFAQRPLWPELLQSQSLDALRMQQQLEAARQREREVEQRLAEANRLRSKAEADEEAVHFLRQQKWQAYRAENERKAQEQIDEVVMRMWSRPASESQTEPQAELVRS